MNQQEIEVMSEALRERGLTWSQTNFAIALARNAIAAAINAMPPDPELERLRAENAAKQAKIDALMLEFCPNELTHEQVANWVSHQRVSDALIDAMLEPKP